MRNIITIIALACAVTAAQAGQWNAGIWTSAGYTGMADVNNEMDARLEAARGTGVTAGIAKIRTVRGYGFDFGRTLAPGWALGLRTGRLTCEQGGMDVLTTAGASVTDVNATIDASLTPLLGGLIMTKPLNRCVTLGGELFLGYGWAEVAADVRRSVNTGAVSRDRYAFEGGTFTGMAAGTISIATAPGVSVGLRLSYWAAKVREIKATKDTSGVFAAVTKGDVYRLAGGDPLRIDLSAAMLGVFCNVAFGS